MGGTTNFIAVNGIFKIEKLQFTGTPGQNYSLKFITDAIDITKPSNKDMLN